MFLEILNYSKLLAKSWWQTTISASELSIKYSISDGLLDELIGMQTPFKCQVAN
jgi:hypothetical protein